MAVRSGLERVLDEESAILEGKRVALLCNPTSVDPQLRHAADLFVRRGFNLRVLFGPEHGVRGDAQDMVASEGEIDPQTHIRVHSLYGHTAESLLDGDVRIFVSVEARDAAINTTVHDLKDYRAQHVRFGMRYADTASVDNQGRTMVDLTRISLLEPDGFLPQATPTELRAVL